MNRAWTWLLAMALLMALGVARGQNLESVLAPGPLIQGHAKTEQDCKACHVRFDRAAQDRLCVECHKDVGRDLAGHTGWHGRREPQACRTCHTDHRGRGAQIASFDLRAFNHAQTDFALRDKHAGVDCAKCHLKGKRWREAPSDCAACHAKDDVHKGGLGRDCAECHNARGWKEAATFDHDKRTRFALSFRHADARCEDCHAQGRYKDTPLACVACHRKDDEREGHKGQFGERCDTCHGARGWKPATFNHDLDTRFALKDRHREAKCGACHTGALYRQKLGTQCVDCHRKDDKHEGSLGARCESCHSARNWKDPLGFDHQKTHFPLLGAHEKTECKGCHKDTRFKETPSACIACHRADDRHAGTLGERCEACHAERDWKTTAGRFDHQKTRFPLFNAHAALRVKCADCHETPRKMRNTATECVACHVRDDRHNGSLGRRCETCHGDRDWKVERFDHTKTRYPLLGRHAVTPCRSCHLSLRMKEVASDCLSCHRKDDKHRAALGAACESCHNPRAWSLWRFDHGRDAHLVLEGAHAKARCTACHAKPAPAGRPIAPLAADCGGCHRKDDPHEGRFGRRCDQCHTQQRWNEVMRR